MLTLMMFAICSLLVLKGMSMLQAAIVACTPGRNWRKWVMLIGVLAFVIGVIGGVGLAAQWTAKAWQLGRAINQF